MKTKLNKNTIHERFASRTWAVRLSVNGQPVNHAGCDSGATVVTYYPLRGETSRDALTRLAFAIERAGLYFEPVELRMMSVERYRSSVVRRVASLLRRRWSSSRVKSRFIVNLWLDENDPATAEVVERIVGW